jgi:type I restriction-modification system DNA methylase subunit
MKASYNHSPHEVYGDWVACCAISISNAVDYVQREKREKEYERIRGKYRAEDFQLFSQALAMLVESLEEGEHDALGAIFGELEVANKHVGQFFTPSELSEVMARMTLDVDSTLDRIHEKGFLTIHEPAVGAGSTLIATAKVLRSYNINYQTQLHLTAVDIDQRCVHMAYTQLALLGIPAVIYHGNSLSMEMHEAWYTPFHIIGGWAHKLRRRDRITSEEAEDILQI